MISNGNASERAERGLGDDGRSSTGCGSSASRRSPPPLIPLFFFFFLCMCYKLTPCLIPKPRSRATAAALEPTWNTVCAACVVTSMHVAHYLRPALCKLISDINTQIRVSLMRMHSYSCKIIEVFVIRIHPLTHNERDNRSDSLRRGPR